jgi:hypothetical protein
MRKLHLIIFMFLISYSAIGNAAVYGGSNLGYSGYPEFSDSEPTPPYDRSEFLMNSYKNDVERYIRNAKDYTENANNDMKRIRESQDEALEKANRVVEEYNRVARGY